MLHINIRSQTTNASFSHAKGPLEFGRGPRREAERFVIADDLTVSRNQLRLEELRSGRVRLDNLSSRTPVYLGDGRRIDTGKSEELHLPLNVSIGQTTVVISSPGHADDAGPVETILKSWHGSPQEFKTLRDLGDAPSAQTIAQWLEMALDLQQTANDLTDLYARTASAMIDLLGLDTAMVLTREGDCWSEVTHHSRHDEAPLSYSLTLLCQMVKEGRTLIRNAGQLPDSESVRAIHCAVVSPIYDVQRNIIGALYGSRSRLPGSQAKITDLEAQILQLFAVAASTRRVRSEATRVRVQFEQFFSPELVRELQDNDDLLEGREREITVLVSDMRGFSRLSEQLGPQKACVVVRDLMDRFTHRILEHGGVIVDYAGDGILAMWNAPVTQEDHAVLACKAALAMRGELPGLNRKWRDLVGGQLDAGIGINTGMAMVGNTGSSRKLKYGPHGSTVNLASRLQDVTKVLGLPLLISHRTQEKLQPDFATRRLFAARLRGIQEVVGIHELCGTDPSLWWQHQRAIYESALERYERGEWCTACQDLVGLMHVCQSEGHPDIPTVRLLRYAWECLEFGREIKPVIDLA